MALLPRPPDPDREIDPLVDEVDDPIRRFDLDLERRMAREEARDPRRDLQDSERHGHREPQRAVGLRLELMDRPLRILGLLEDPPAALVEEAAELGQAHAPGRARQ